MQNNIPLELALEAIRFVAVFLAIAIVVPILTRGKVTPCSYNERNTWIGAAALALVPTIVISLLRLFFVVQESLPTAGEVLCIKQFLYVWGAALLSDKQAYLNLPRRDSSIWACGCIAGIVDCVASTQLHLAFTR